LFCGTQFAIWFAGDATMIVRAANTSVDASAVQEIAVLVRKCVAPSWAAVTIGALVFATRDPVNPVSVRCASRALVA
jgi:hypothetical protein